MQRLLNSVERAGFLVGSVVLVAMVFATTLDASLRYFFHAPLRGVSELTGDYAMPLAIFLAMARCYRTGSNVRIVLVVRLLKGNALVAANVTVQLFVSAVLAVMTYAVWLQVVRTYVSKSSVSGAVSYPLWPSYAAVFFGLLLTAAFAILDITRAKSGKTGALLGGDEEI